MYSLLQYILWSGNDNSAEKDLLLLSNLILQGQILNKKKQLNLQLQHKYLPFLTLFKVQSFLKLT